MSGKKNYKRYWGILKDNKILRLVFQMGNFPSDSKLMHEVNLWKSGLSREKYKDYKYQTKNPYHRIEYKVEWNSDKSTATLEANLLDANELLKSNPKIEFLPSLEGEGEE